MARILARRPRLTVPAPRLSLALPAWDTTGFADEARHAGGRPRRPPVLPERLRRPRLPGRLAEAARSAQRRRPLLRRDDRGRLHGRPRDREPPRRASLDAHRGQPGPRRLRHARARDRRVRRREHVDLLRLAVPEGRAPALAVLAGGAAPRRRPPAADDTHGDVAA